MNNQEKIDEIRKDNIIKINDKAEELKTKIYLENRWYKKKEMRRIESALQLLPAYPTAYQKADWEEYNFSIEKILDEIITEIKENKNTIGTDINFDKYIKFFKDMQKQEI